MYRSFFFILFSAAFLHAQSTSILLTGKVLDEYSSSPVSGCSVFSDNGNAGTITDSAGAFTLKVASSVRSLTFSHIAYKKFSYTLQGNKSHSNQKLIIKLHPTEQIEDEIIVTDKRNPDMQAQEMVAKDIYRVPTAFNDVLRGVTILSGVSTNNELSSGYNVRGGNYNENLIYLNGFEIYRPFLLREGEEENQTLINPDLVDKLDFYNGGFSAAYGDKMSSALSVEYRHKAADTLRSKARASLLNAGLSMDKRFGSLDILVAGRYAYPGLFLSRLQTSGKYHPYYADIQALATYHFSEGNELQLFLIQANNTYDLTPSDWTGNIQSDRGTGLINAIQILYKGKREYSFLTSFAALRYTAKLSKNSGLSVSFSGNLHKESDIENLSGDFFYVPDAYLMDQGREYLKTRVETADDHLETKQADLNATYTATIASHTFQSSVFKRWSFVDDRVNETVSEYGDVVILDNPAAIINSSRYNPDEIGGYVMDTYKPDNHFEIKGGLRALSEKMTGEFLFSPRLESSYKFSADNSIFAAWGYYYQPPYYLERRYNDVPLKSQRTIHYSAGWENRFKSSMFFKIELYYKSLYNLIPYYTDDEKIIYTGTNQNEGYAYGMDVMFHGELIQGIQSWLGYGYLNTRERPMSGGSYVRRLTDQTHSILIFLQDRIKKHSNWQVHTRIIAGSGVLYYDRRVVTDPVTGQKTLAIAFDQPLEYLLYFRADMGCSTELSLGAGKKMTLTAEVLNVFNQNNYAGFEFIQVFKDIPVPIKVPQVLSPRFFNIQAEFEF